MKSILQEAPSVAKAVDKAWNKAGRPLDFSVKIFNVEKRGFFGWLKRPAVISLSFETPRHLEQFSKTQKGSKNKKNDTRSRKGNTYQSNNYQVKEPVLKRTERPDNKNLKSYSKDEESSSWTKESIQDINIWINDIVNIMGIDVNFTVSVSNQLLKILFEEPVVSDVSDERLLFSSYAYVLMQFLKRKYKRKFKDCRIAITSNR